MRRVLFFISCIILVACIITAALVFVDELPLDTYKVTNLLLTIAWFATAPWWMLPSKKI